LVNGKIGIKKTQNCSLLDPNDIKFIANEWRKIPENISDTDKETWNRIAFRFMTSLNKAGIEYKPEFPNENGKYYLNK